MSERQVIDRVGRQREGVGHHRPAVEDEILQAQRHTLIAQEIVEGRAGTNLWQIERRAADREAALEQLEVAEVDLRAGKLREAHRG